LWVILADLEPQHDSRGEDEPLLVDLLSELEDVWQSSPFQFSLKLGTSHALLDDPGIDPTASPPDRNSARTGEAVNVDQPHQAGVGPEVELDIAIFHDGKCASTRLGYVLRFAERILDRVTIDAERDLSETPATKGVSQEYDRHMGSSRKKRMFGIIPAVAAMNLGRIRPS
jgi:hypothetical protein